MNFNIPQQTVETKEYREAHHSSQEAIDAAIAVLEEQFDNSWRETRRRPDGTYEPRIKTTTDQEWIAQHGTDQVDIANTPFHEKPKDWQAENHAAAEEIVEIFDEHNGLIDTSDPDEREEVGEEIHEDWLRRNPWAKGTELDVPFEQLTKEEQDKDIDQITVAEETVFLQDNDAFLAHHS